MSPGGAEAAGGMPQHLLIKLGIVKDGSQSPGGQQDQRGPALAEPTSAGGVPQRPRPGGEGDRIVSAPQADRPAAQAGENRPATGGPGQQPRDADALGRIRSTPLNPRDNGREPGNQAATSQSQPGVSRQADRTSATSVSALFAQHGHRIGRGSAESQDGIAPVPGEAGRLTDDTLGGSAGTAGQAEQPVGRPADARRVFGARTASEPGGEVPQDTDSGPDERGRTGEPTGPGAVRGEGLIGGADRGHERQERQERPGEHHEADQEYAETPGPATGQQEAQLLWRENTPPPNGHREAPNRLRELSQKGADARLARTMPLDEDVAAKQRGKISKFGGKVAHHLSTVAKEAGGLFLGTVGGANVWGLETGNEKIVLLGSLGATALVAYDLFKTNLLPAMFAPKLVGGVISTTGATAGLAIATEMGAVSASLSEYVAGVGALLIAWGGKDIYNKVRYGQLIKKDNANTDREYLKKLRLGKPGAKGKPGLFDLEMQARERDLTQGTNRYKHLDSEHRRLYYESLSDEMRALRVAQLTQAKRLEYDKASARWNKEAAQRLAAMKPKSRGYQRTFWASLSEPQRQVFEQLDAADSQQKARAHATLRGFWDELTMQQQQVFVALNADSRKALLDKRPKWNKQAEVDQQKVAHQMKKLFRKLEIYRGRFDRIVEAKAIVADGKDAKNRLIFRTKQKARKENAGREEQRV